MPPITYRNGGLGLTVAPGGGGNALQTAANALSANQWTKFDTGNTSWANSQIMEPPGGTQLGYSVAEFANNASWDHVNHRMMFFGGNHQNAGATIYWNGFLKYDAGTDTWTNTIGNTGEIGQNVELHAYNQNTTDDAGVHYFLQYASSVIYYTSDYGATWSNMDSGAGNLAWGTAGQSGQALVWFPDRGSLLRIDGDYGISEWIKNTNTWSYIANTNNTQSAYPGVPNCTFESHYSNWACYNPDQQAVYFGGTNAMWKMDKLGNFTSKTASPNKIYIDGTCLVASHPTTGANKLVSLVGGTGQTTNNGLAYSIMTYDCVGNSWSTAGAGTTGTNSGTGAPPLMGINGQGQNSLFDCLICPIFEYGVLMFPRFDYTGIGTTYDGSVYLWKPA